MDFKNFCQKIDVDSIRAKIPSMPAMPAMPAVPQLKLPKSISKFKSRKIFRSSREDVTESTTKPGLPPRPPIHSAGFINRTPTRISTITSLMYESDDREHNTYRSAHSIEEDYPSPTQTSRKACGSISPMRTSISNIDTPEMGSRSNVKMSLSEKLQKGYKDISDFRLKHIFAKKTVLRKDAIVVDNYVPSFNEERQRAERETEQRDRAIADDYRFKFKISRQNTGHTDSIDSNDSASPRKAAKSDQSGDESGLESPPRRHKPGVAATRFAKVRSPPLRQSMSEETNDEDRYEEARGDAPNPSTLWSIKENRTPVEVSPIASANSETQPPATNKEKPKGYKERLKRLTNYVSSHDESGTDSNPEGPTTTERPNVFNKLRFNRQEPTEEKKRKAPVSPQQSKDAAGTKPAESQFNPIKASIVYNFKRIQMSFKRPPDSPVESSDDEDKANPVKPQSRTQKLTARLRKFKGSASDKEDEENGKEETRSGFSNKLQNFKKSLRRRANETEGNESSPEKSKLSGTFIKKLNYIRTRKNPNSTEELNDGENPVKSADNEAKESTTRKQSNFEEKLEHARKKTMQKVNEKMQHMKFFQKSEENVAKGKQSDSEEESNIPSNQVANVPPAISRRSIHDASDSDADEENIEEISTQFSTRNTRAVWTTKPILTDSIDSDLDAEFPRVLIHQDNSDSYDATLIIAVTRPRLSSVTSSSSAKITEILPERSTTPTPPTPPAKPVDWVTNRDIITGFLDMTPPDKRKMSVESISTSRPRPRKASMDSNSDSDSWKSDNVLPKRRSNQSKESSRRASAAGLNMIDEKEEPWKVSASSYRESLYKTKSIDIFERSGGKIFADFDDELKNAPVVKIAHIMDESPDRDSSEEADDDNSSRVTKICVQVNQRSESPKEFKNPVEPLSGHIGNSRESLIANFDENEENEANETTDESDRPPSAPPSPPPPTCTPPRAPQRRPQAVKSLDEQELPPLPAFKPPLPPMPATKPPLPPLPLAKPSLPPKIPERSASMNRPAKPLVKTSSLRLAYNEQVKPADVGKVNKLISRFEQPSGTTQTKKPERPRIVARRVLRDESEEYSDDQESYDDESDVVFESQKQNNNNNHIRGSTPTPTNTPRTNSLEVEDHNSSKTKADNFTFVITAPSSNESLIHEDQNANDLARATMSMDMNSNTSQPGSVHGSVYGSPLEYPSSLIGSSETTPIATPMAERKHQQHQLEIHSRRSRRSMTRDDDNFYSFDSDEENSYYSISSTGSSRYIVEL